ncbi:hypothetical protein NL676_027470 [Syzygium grande]|nr:hypothetical protein NL676_027470 [Syzygium grande]
MDVMLQRGLSFTANVYMRPTLIGKYEHLNIACYKAHPPSEVCLLLCGLSYWAAWILPFGKTLLARVVASKASMLFFSCAASGFVELFVGVGASRSKATCTAFIDEIDAVRRQRGAGLGGGNDESEQTINWLLPEMVGFSGNSGVMVLAAMNKPDVLDSALLRTGRFDRQVTGDRPDVAGRVKIFQVHS